MPVRVVLMYMQDGVRIPTPDKFPDVVALDVESWEAVTTEMVETAISRVNTWNKVVPAQSVEVAYALLA